MVPSSLGHTWILFLGYTWILRELSLDKTDASNLRSNLGHHPAPEAPFRCLGRFRHEASLELGVAAPGKPKGW